MPKIVADVVERALATYAEAFLGLLLASTSGLTDISTLRAAAVAALPTALAVVKGAVGTRIGHLTAAWIPARKKPEQ
ncbi:hypothetical protein [Streptomyces sp. NPDC001404]|uniref:hypothetical protein n=1 Tax=Streptomyces sp. NPDC001404 TaxID=3364571 RepID=UPI00369FE18C